MRPNTSMLIPCPIGKAQWLFALLLITSIPAFAGTVKLAWDPPTGAAPAGYMVYYGPSAGNYSAKIDVGNVTTYTVSGLAEGATYHFAATDYNAGRAESGFSNDVGATVAYTVPVAGFSASAVSGTAPFPVEFTSTSIGTISSYAWTFGDGTSSTLAAPVKVFNSPGVYSIGLTVTGPGGSGTQSKTNFVTVVAPPPTTMTRLGAAVDAHSATGTSSNLNGVLEPGETVRVEPTWQNSTGSTITLTGTASGFSGPAGATYTLGDPGANYGSVASGAVANCQTAMTDCYRMSVSNPATRPTLHWDAVFTETLSNGVAVTSFLHVGHSFSDVPDTDIMYDYVETIVHNNVTLGYADGTFQPAAPSIRAATMIFVARGAVAPVGNGALPASGLVGSTTYNCTAGGTSVIVDILPTDVGCKQVHYLLSKGVNVNFQCSAAHACPSSNTSRAAMSVLISGAIASGGDAGVPAFGTFSDSGAARSYDCRVAGGSHFADVLNTDAFCRHVNYLWARNVVGGYADGTFKPADNVSRSQMAKFISEGFALSLY
jgi:PKD repeat protein